MNKDLQAQIQAAREAARQVAEADALRQQAAELPRLEEEARYIEHKQQAKANLERAIESTRAALEEAAPGVQNWHDRFNAAVAELGVLIEELPTTQRPIIEAGRRLHRAAQDAALFSPAYRQIGHLAGDAFLDHWTAVGGMDSRLALLDDKPVNTLYGQVVQLAFKKIAVYTPSTWARFF